jgi:hypothetical protein
MDSLPDRLYSGPSRSAPARVRGVEKGETVYGTGMFSWIYALIARCIVINYPEIPRNENQNTAASLLGHPRIGKSILQTTSYICI